MGFGHRNITIFVMVGVFGFLLGSFGIYSSNTDNSFPTESVMAVGHLELVLKDADGNIKNYQQTDNQIVDVGLNTMADLIFPGIDLNSNSTVDSKFNVIAIGTGLTTANPTNTSLESPLTGCLNATASVFGIPVDGATGPITTLVANFSAFNGCSSITSFNEAVIYNDLSDGEMLARQVFISPITIGEFDELEIFWDIELGGT